MHEFRYTFHKFRYSLHDSTRFTKYQINGLIATVLRKEKKHVRPCRNYTENARIIQFTYKIITKRKKRH